MSEQRRATLAWARTAIYLVLILGIVEAAVRANIQTLLDYDQRARQAHHVKPEIYSSIAAPDLCFLGSSKVDIGCRSALFTGRELFGTRVETAFNFGIGGALGATLANAIQPMTATKKWPKVVIWETAEFTFDPGFMVDDVWMSAVPGSWRESRSFELLWKHLVGRADGLLESCVATYRFREALEYALYDRVLARLPGRPQFNAAVHAKALKAAKRSPSAGARRDGDCLVFAAECPDGKLSDQSSRPDFIAPNREAGPHYKLDPRWAGLFEKAVDSLLSHDVKVIFIYIPPSRFLAPQEAYMRYMTDIAARKRTPFLAFTRAECGLADEDYLDTVHLNGAGGIKFSKCLLKRLPRGAGL